MKRKQVWILALSGGILLLTAASIWGFSRKQFRLSICDIQGRGEISPYAGKQVKTRGLISSNQPNLDPAGFFLVDPDCGITEGGSAGVFVQTAGVGELIHEGDEVWIAGEVSEVEGETRILVVPDQIQIVSMGNSLPQVVDLSQIFQINPGLFSYETWEGQLISIGNGEILGSYPQSVPLRFLPFLDPPASAQLICISDESISLGFLGLDQVEEQNSLEPGSEIEMLTGFLRQEISGYAIQILADQGLEITSPIHNSDRTQIGEREQAAVTVTITHQAYIGTKTSTPYSSLTPTSTLIPTPTWYPVDLLISELLPNPEGKEPLGEWFEIYNPKSYGQILTGIKVGDETSPSGKEGVLRFPDGYYIEAKEVLVIAHQAVDFNRVYGFYPDFELEDSLANIPDLLVYDGWGRNSVQFSNSGDEIILLDPWDQLVDSLAYGKGSVTGFTNPPGSPKEGNSLERYPPERDRDRGGDWRERGNPSPGRLDRSLPTQAVTDTPIANTPTLNQSLTASPDPTPSPEVSKTATKTIYPETPTNTMTYTPSPLSTSGASPTSQTITVSPSLTAAPLTTWTSTPTSGIRPSSTEDLPDTPTISDTGTTAASLTPGVSPTQWSSLTPSPGSTEEISSTPTRTIAPNLSLTPTFDQINLLVLNEIHADPDLEAGDANADGVVSSDDDEFIELVNAGDQVLDLSGWQVADSVRPRFKFSEGTILDPGCALVIFGGGEPWGEFGGSEIFLASSLGLNNAGDSIIILDEVGVERINIRYGSEGGEDQSLTLFPDLERDLPMVLHSEVSEALGVLFSPGTMVDGSRFPDCLNMEEPP